MKPTVQYVTTTQVINIEERFNRLYVSGHGADAVFEEKSVGWFLVTRSGTYCFGQKRPTDLLIGDTIDITFERHRRADEASAAA